jgi:lipopolysaccharide/colanic/teichoic acid biosynthesis glycosyltransferase
LKRFLDFIISFFGLLIAAPVLILVILLVWVQDFQSPFYIAQRVGKDKKEFKMIKLRSMIVDADSSGVDSTSANDTRITPIGHFIRKFKLDELTQLWNVFKGEMSLVGPRPNVKAETDLYTTDEKILLSVRPGITDLSSIIFSDEGDILENKENPDLAYNQLIRPWKSRLGLIYIKNQTFLLDIQLILFTVLAIFSRSIATNWVTKKLQKLGVDKNIVAISKREDELYPFPPPGSDKIVENR